MVPRVWLGIDGVNSERNVITTLAVLDPGRFTGRNEGVGHRDIHVERGTLESRDQRLSIWLPAFRIPIHVRCMI